MEWSAACELPRYGSLCRNASPGARSGCSSRIDSPSGSDPNTWTGAPSALANSWPSAVRIEQEKSRAVLSTDDRPDRNSPLVISRTIPSNAFAKTGSRTGSNGVVMLLPLMCQVKVAGSVDLEAPTGRDHHRGRWLVDDGGSLDDLVRPHYGARVARR